MDEPIHFEIDPEDNVKPQLTIRVWVTASLS